MQFKIRAYPAPVDLLRDLDTHEIKYKTFIRVGIDYTWRIFEFDKKINAEDITMCVMVHGLIPVSEEKINWFRKFLNDYNFILP